MDLRIAKNVGKSLAVLMTMVMGWYDAEHMA
jgi:hypothetical protein